MAAINKLCSKCDVVLIPHENWHTCLVERNTYKCKDCHKAAATKSNPGTNKNRMYVDGKHISSNHPLHKPGRYKTFDDAAFQGTYKLDSIKEGYVYVITNPAWPEWVKIGMAIDADDRCNGYQTSSPFRDYILEHVMVTNNRRVSEAKAHIEAAKIAEEQRGEWFKLNVEEAKKIINTCSTIVKTEVKKEEKPKQEQKQPAIQDLFTYAEIRARSEEVDGG